MGHGEDDRSPRSEHRVELDRDTTDHRVSLLSSFIFIDCVEFTLERAALFILQAQSSNSKVGRPHSDGRG